MGASGVAANAGSDCEWSGHPAGLERKDGPPRGASRRAGEVTPCPASASSRHRQADHEWPQASNGQDGVAPRNRSETPGRSGENGKGPPFPLVARARAHQPPIPPQHLFRHQRPAIARQQHQPAHAYRRPRGRADGEIDERRLRSRYRAANGRRSFPTRSPTRPWSSIPRSRRNSASSHRPTCSPCSTSTSSARRAA